MAAPALSIDPYFRDRLAQMPAPDADNTRALVGDAVLSRLYAQTVARSSPKKSSDNAVCQISDDVASHNHASYAQRYRSEAMSSANGQSTRTNVEPGSSWVHDKLQIKQRVSAALKEDHAHKHSHLKLIARQAGTSPRTVEGWTSAQYLPGLEHFLRLVPKSPALQRMLAELRALDADTDPRHGVLLAQIQKQAR